MPVTNLCRIFFQFYGYFSEGIDFYDEHGKRVFMARYDYIGNNITIPLSAEEFTQLPEPGTLVFVQGIVRVDKKNGKLKLEVLGISIEGRDPKFVQPTADQLMAGATFWGDVIVSDKVSGIYRDNPFRNVTIALFGGSYLFRLVNDEDLFNQFPQSGITYISGGVETVIASVEKDGRRIKVCENNLLLQKVGKAQTIQPEPKPAKSTAA